MKRRAGNVICGLFLFLSTVFCYAQEAEEGIGNSLTNGTNGTESAVQKPNWLEQAEKTYMEGIKAQEAGDDKLAAEKIGQCLKFLGEKADQDCLISIKGEVASLFSKAEEYFLNLPEKNNEQPSELLEVSEQELAGVQAPLGPLKTRKIKYTIPVDPANPLVRKYITVYTGQYKAAFQKALDKMGLYEKMISEEIRKLKLPRELIYLPLVESEFKNTARSYAGAVGLWQFIADTGRKYGLDVNYWVDERRDPVKATQAALQHLKDLHDWFQDWHLALAAYNRGTYGVEKDLLNTRSTEYLAASERNGFPRETEHYVPKMMACILIADNAESYGFRADTRLKPVATEEVLLEKPLDMGIAAKCAGVSKEAMEELNPAVRLWCTPKDQKDFVLKIPAGKKQSFLEALAQVNDWNPAPEMIRYRVGRGDYLGRIAEKFHTTVRDIMQQNKIISIKHLRAGQILIIRPGRKYKG